MYMSKKVKKRLKATSSKRLFRSRGFIADFAIIILAVVLGIFLIGNLFPKIPSSSNPLDQYEIDATIDPTVHNNLQLKTFKFQKCLASIAISFLIDQSGSMDDFINRADRSKGTKLANLQTGLRYFASRFPDKGAIALQIHKTNSDWPIPIKYNQLLVDYGYFQDKKTQFLQQIAGFSPLGATYSKDAFTELKTNLFRAIDSNIFPNSYKFAVVYISDGIPETAEMNNKYFNPTAGLGGSLCNPIDATDTALGVRCTPYTNVRTNRSSCRCLDPNQDPRSVADEIKARGIRIFTIRYIGDADGYFDDDLQRIMEGIATTPQDAYVAPLNEQLDKVIDQIATRACSTLSPL